METIKNLIIKYQEPLRFLVIGVVNTIFGYSLFTAGLFGLTGIIQPLAQSSNAVLRLIGDNYYILIQWITWVLSVPFGAYTMKYYVFKSPGAYLPQLIKAYGVYLPAQLLSSVLLILFVRVVGLGPLLGQFCTIFFATIVSYIGHKYFTFRTPLEVGEVIPEDMLEEKGARHDTV